MEAEERMLAPPPAEGDWPEYPLGEPPEDDERG
jgi:hypothetical protein